MDDATIEFVLSDSEIDPVSEVPIATVVFMLYYGLELKNFLMEISDDFIKKYPLKQYHVGTSSMYLSGSAAQGLYLNTKYLPDARDIDIVTINRKYDIRERCKYDKSGHEHVLNVKMQEIDENNQMCIQNANANCTTCGYEDKYLNIKVLPDTPPGYVLLEKCRRQPLPVQTVDDVYVSSLKTTEARVKYWHEMKSFIRQWFDKQEKDSSLFSSVVAHGPAATAYMSGFESTTPFEVDMVFCVPYPRAWLKIAEEWLYRERPSGWPPQSLIDEIYNDGCTLIPKGSVGSPMEDYEWRISFTGDLKLARSLSVVQREMLHVLKALISGPPGNEEISGLVTHIESYQFLNLMYYESEQQSKDIWRQRNIAKLLFHFLDKYLEHFKNRHMSHYFIKSRNIFAKLETMSEEELDTLLYTIQRLRRDPLGQLLHQSRYIRLPLELHERVYTPLIEHAKEAGEMRPQLYVSTLIRLSKAHILKELYNSANIYANQALTFYYKMKTDTLSDEEYMDLMYTVVISYYFEGTSGKVLEYLEKMHLLMHTKSQLELIRIFGKASYSQILVIFARSLIVSLQSGTRVAQQETVIEAAKRMYKEARHIDPSNLSLDLDMLNTLLHLRQFEDSGVIITDLSRQFPDFPVFSSEENMAAEATSSESATKYHVELIYDRAEYVRLLRETEHTEGHYEQIGVQEQTIILQETDNDVIMEGNSRVTHFPDRWNNFETPFEAGSSELYTEKTFLSTSDETMHDDPVLQSCTGMQTEMLESEYSNHQNEQVLETQFLTELSFEMESHPRDNVYQSSTGTGEIIYDRKQYLESENLDMDSVSFSTEDVNNLDADLFTDYCRMKAFRELKMDEKADQISDRLQRKFTAERRNGKKVSMKMLEVAYKMFYPQNHQQQPETGDVFYDILSKDRNFVVYSKADFPLLDEVTKCVFRSDSTSVVRIPVKIAFLNSMIRFYMAVGNVNAARNSLAMLESIVDDWPDERDESVTKYVAACHLERFAENDAAREMFRQAEIQGHDLSIAEQVSHWFSQVFSVVTTMEPKNEYLDAIFDV